MNCVFAYTNQIEDYHRSTRYESIRKSFISTNALKLGFLVAFFIAVVGVYTITVNISSTKGYYYSQAVKAKDKAEFNYNITKLNVMTMQSDLRNQISFVSQDKKEIMKEIIIQK